MPFKASDIKVTIKMKKIVKLLILLNIWRVHLCSVDSYLVAFWAITHIRIYWIHRRKLFPYFELSKMGSLTHFGLEK